MSWKKTRSAKNLYPDNRLYNYNSREKNIIFAAKNAAILSEPNKENINEVFY